MTDHTPQPPYYAEVLQRAIIAQTKKGWRVVESTDRFAVLEKGRGVSHGLHLALTILTCGMWLLIWPMLTLVNRKKSILISVDMLGNVTRVKRVAR